MKKAMRKIYPLLPRMMRYDVVRRGVRLPAELSSDFEFKLATDVEEMEQAFRVLHDAYVDMNYMVPHPSGLRVTKYHAMPTTSMIIGKYKGEVIGTLSIIRNSPIGLPLKDAIDLDPLRAKYGQIAEISSLAVRKDFRKQNGAVFWAMLKFFYHYTKDFARLSAIIVGAHPKWADFYIGIMGFKSINVPRSGYEFANGNIVAAFLLDLEKAPFDFYSTYAHLPDRRNLYNFFSSPCSAHYKFPKREFYKVSDPMLTPDLMNLFFTMKTNVLETLNEHELLAVSSAYPDIYSDIFEKLGKAPPQNREEIRFVVNCPAISGKGSKLEVLDVSPRSLRVRGRTSKKSDCLQVRIGDFNIVDLHVEHLWREGDQNGFKILNAPSEWDNYINYLHSDFVDNAGYGTISINSH